jgi:F-type H+-transporting ATPase subunit gamma
MMNVKPILIKFLPLSLNKETSNLSSKYSVKYIMEPEPVKLLNNFLPKYVDMKVYQIILESFTSEFAARMSAMTLASDNAEELKKTLTITYNKIRQTSITKELLDIVGGAEALK